MPSEHCIPQDVAHIDQTQQQAQVKLCSSCHYPLSPDSIILHPDAAFVCTPCRERICALRDFVEHPERQRDDVAPVEDFGLPLIAQDAPMDLRPATPPPASPTQPPISTSSPLPLHHQHQQTSPSTTPAALPPSPPPHASTSFADPYTDITRIRARSHSQDCLYPGAQFFGTQKSGRSSYEVSVTIVDVDFSSSFLCGYLRIRGLTDDWPELTTYFDAQIIGSRHGFLTDDWGATEDEDMIHWSRFPAFEKMKQELRGPRLHVRDRDRDCVFMRWKERFLVPDHRVRDINGASFAGFYYVCVDFNPQGGSGALQPQLWPPLAPEAPSFKNDGLRPYRDQGASPSSAAWQADKRRERSSATMSGYYFHQNSEPYQQLSLRHVPTAGTSSFEFR